MNDQIFDGNKADKLGVNKRPKKIFLKKQLRAVSRKHVTINTSGVKEKMSLK